MEKTKAKKKRKRRKGDWGTKRKKIFHLFCISIYLFFLSWLYFTVFFSLPLYRYIHILFFY